MITTLDFACFRANKDFQFEVLLGKRKKINEPAFGEFALVGGWVWEEKITPDSTCDEDLDGAVSRILNSKLGIQPKLLEQVESKGSRGRDSRGWSMTVVHYCLLNAEDSKHLDEDADFKWVSVESILSGDVKLPFDHAELIQVAAGRFARKSTYSSIGLYLLPEAFTVAQAINTFKGFGLALSKQTVANRWIKSGLIRELGVCKTPSLSGKPPMSFCINETKPTYFQTSLTLDENHWLQIGF